MAGIKAISDLAEIDLDVGCAYLCTWGADCEPAHDIFDKVKVGENPDPEDDRVVLTVRHDGESINENFCFFLRRA
ncbi:MAG: hypothetical protein K0U98_10390 [Deltaproteobacteria bacterium]|nr:hypothetical protein [Deltaproteobacteria bacterium]